MSRSLLEAKGVEVGHHQKVVLSGVDLRIEAGESVALLGPNGSGKSTLLNTICGVLPLLAGSLHIGGEPVTNLSSRELSLRVAMVPQDEASPFPFLVREIVAMGRLARGNGLLETQEDRQVAHRAMIEADCADLAERPITELSGGERQRVLIARALAQEAPLILMDEPTAHLDPPHQIALAHRAQKLAESGCAVVAAVHDLNLAGLFARRAVLIHQGRIVMDSSVEDVLESTILDAVYGVSFERLRSASGRRLVLASSPS